MLEADEGSVESVVVLDEVVVRAGLHDLAILDDSDDVRVADGGEAVGDDDGGAAILCQPGYHCCPTNKIPSTHFIKHPHRFVHLPTLWHTNSEPLPQQKHHPHTLDQSLGAKSPRHSSNPTASYTPSAQQCKLSYRV